MDIYLVRHGIAEEAGEGVRHDSERKLTNEGIEKTTAVAKAFRRRVSRLGVIFHSPYLRAEQTAKIFAAEFPEAQLIEANGLTPHDRARQALPLLQSVGDDESLMIVGHEPHLSSLASLLLTGSDTPILEFKKAGIAGIDCHRIGQDCRLLFLLSPKWL